MSFSDAPAAAPARIAPLRIAPPFAGGLPSLALCACVRRLPSRFPPFCFQFEFHMNQRLAKTGL